MFLYISAKIYKKVYVGKHCLINAHKVHIVSASQ